ncbi:MAG: hypothetical protein ACK5U7_14710 [Bacteroidota bacterium]|jgi:hypothetical protein
MRQFLILTLLATLVVAAAGGLQSCCKEQCHDPQNPECENYDPCWGRSIENGILISNKTSFAVIDNWFHPDVKFWRGNIHFRPEKKIAGAKYTWYLGSEVIEEFEFTRNFDVTKTTKEQGIPVKLIIERPKRTRLFSQR